MRLLEFQADHVLIKDVFNALSSRFHLERVGGHVRVYTVGQELGVVYLVDNGPKAVGLTWQRGSNVITHVCVWNTFNASHSPDIMAEIPMGSAPQILAAIGDLVASPHIGMFEALEPEAEPAPPVQLVAKATNVHFEVPGVTETSRQIDHHFASEEDAPQTMEEQYEDLKEKVALIASNSSNYIKSLLITGAPSSGKTFTVMKTIKELGLKEGIDYIVIKGSITDVGMYLTFIKQLDALTVFDDCDSVTKTEEGTNMLKNALDTYAIRDIGRENANSINTQQMGTDERTEFVESISRILRGKPTAADFARFDNYVPSKIKAKAKIDAKHKDASGGAADDVHIQQTGDMLGKIFSLPDPNGSLDSLDDAGASNSERLLELQAYFTRRPPNRIDFRGRVIFISNKDESEWDKAILTRAFRVNMNFSNEEMFDFIVKIKGTIAAPGLTDEQKDEVLAYIKHLMETNRLQSPVNFRLIQQAFDLRLCGPWKRMVEAL